MTKLGAIITLFYILYNRHLWSILTNEEIIISKTIVTIIKIFPYSFWTIVGSLSILLLIYSIFIKENIWTRLISWISIYIMFVGIGISWSQLGLNDTTVFALFKIHHPISMEIKNMYFQTELSKFLKIYYTNLDENTFIYFNENVLQYIDINIIKNMTAKEITDFAHNIVFQKNESQLPKYSFGAIVMFIFYTLQSTGVTITSFYSKWKN